MAEGKEELMAEFTEKPKAELTAEELEKVERRREQNRMAARRFRKKQNTLETKLQKKTQKLESDNTSLRNQMRELTRETGNSSESTTGTPVHLTLRHWPNMQLNVPS